MSLVGYMNIASNAGDTFTNARDNDMLIYTQANTQNILLGAAAGGVANLTISSNLAQFNGNIAINNALAIRGLQIMTNDGSSMNVTQTSVTGFSNDNAGVVLSIGSTANSFRFMAASTQVASLTGTGNLQVSGTITGNISAANITSGTLPVTRGGTGTTTSTGTGNNVLSADPTFTGTVTAATINATTLQTGTTTRISSTGALQNVTADAGIITTGTVATARLQAASTAASGIVQLDNTVTSTSTTTAGTANAVKTAYDLANMTGSMIIIQGVATANTNFSVGVWFDRPLTTIAGYNTNSVVVSTSLTNNQFTLYAGSYHIHAEAVQYNANASKLRVYNATDATVISYGCSVRNNLGANMQISYSCDAVFTISANKAISIQCYIESNPGSGGNGGVLIAIGTEVVTNVIVRRLA